VSCSGDVCGYRLKAKTLPELNELDQKLIASPWYAAIFLKGSSGVDGTVMQHRSLAPLDGSLALRRYLSLVVNDARACLPFTRVHGHVDDHGTFTITRVEGGGDDTVDCIRARAKLHDPAALPDGVTVTPADAELAPVPW